MIHRNNLWPLLILGVTAIVCSKALFFSFNDPEGPNLLIVAVMAAIIFAVSLLAYRATFSTPIKYFLAILIQIIVVTGLYFVLK